MSTEPIARITAGDVKFSLAISCRPVVWRSNSAASSAFDLTVRVGVARETHWGRSYDAQTAGPGRTSSCDTHSLCPPRASHPLRHVVPRRSVRLRLLRRLDDAVLRHRLTTIVAGPGTGKTTLLGQWAAGGTRRVAHGGRRRIRSGADALR